MVPMTSPQCLQKPAMSMYVILYPISAAAHPNVANLSSARVLLRKTASTPIDPESSLSLNHDCCFKSTRLQICIRSILPLGRNLTFKLVYKSESLSDPLVVVLLLSSSCFPVYYLRSAGFVSLFSVVRFTSPQYVDHHLSTAYANF